MWKVNSDGREVLQPNRDRGKENNIQFYRFVQVIDFPASCKCLKFERLLIRGQKTLDSLSENLIRWPGYSLKL